MPSISEVSRPDERKRVTMHLTNPMHPAGKKFPLDIEFFLNRVTGEPIPEEVVQKYLRDHGEEDDDEESPSFTNLRNALAFCDIVASWDLTGPLTDRWTGETLVESDEDVIPLEPRMVRLLPAWLTNQVSRELSELVNPNRNGSRRSRRR